MLRELCKKLSTCPTVTLDLTQPNNYLQFQRATTSSQDRHTPSFFPLPLHGNPQNYSEDLMHLWYRVPLPTMLAPENKNLALVDVVSEAITKDPSLKLNASVAFQSDPPGILICYFLYWSRIIELILANTRSIPRNFSARTMRSTGVRSTYDNPGLIY